MFGFIKKAVSVLVLLFLILVVVLGIENITLKDIKLIMNWKPVQNSEDIEISITSPANKIGLNDSVVLTAEVGGGKNENEVEWSCVRVPGWWDKSFGRNIVGLYPPRGKETNLNLTQEGMGTVYVEAALNIVEPDGEKIRLQAKPYKLYIVQD